MKRNFKISLKTVSHCVTRHTVSHLIFTDATYAERETDGPGLPGVG